MPSISVVMATKDRRALAVRCVESLRAQTRAPLEILAVDNGSGDGTPEALAALAGVRVLSEARPGPAAARNAGVDASRGEVIAFIDDDAVAAADWLERIARGLEETGAAGIGGPTVGEWEGAPPARLLASAKARSYVGDFTLGARAYRLEGVRDFLSGANCAFRREVFDAGLSFRTPPWGRLVGAEDLEFSRAAAARWPVWYDPRVVVRHRIPASKYGWTALAANAFDQGLKKPAMRRPLCPRGPKDLHGVDGWLSLFSGLGFGAGWALRLSRGLP